VSPTPWRCCSGSQQTPEKYKRVVIHVSVHLVFDKKGGKIKKFTVVIAVLRIRDVYPGSRILIFTHPGSRIQKQQQKREVKKN
jgi:hypothetical protein